MAIVKLRRVKLIAFVAVILCSMVLIYQPGNFAAEMASPESLMQNRFSIMLAELLQLEPCFFDDNDDEPCESDANSNDPNPEQTGSLD